MSAIRFQGITKVILQDAAGKPLPKTVSSEIQDQLKAQLCPSRHDQILEHTGRRDADGYEFMVLLTNDKEGDHATQYERTTALRTSKIQVPSPWYVGGRYLGIDFKEVAYGLLNLALLPFNKQVDGPLAAYSKEEQAFRAERSQARVAWTQKGEVSQNVLPLTVDITPAKIQAAPAKNQ